MEVAEDELSDNNDDGICTYKVLRKYVTLMGAISLFGSCWMFGYQLNTKLITDLDIVPDMSFVFYTSTITFSISLITGAHLERMELIIPYFMLAVNLTGFYVAQVMIIMPNWNHMKDPSQSVTVAGICLTYMLISTYFLSEFMKSLSSKNNTNSRPSNTSP